MNFQTIGDLAQSFALRRQGVDLKQQIDRLGGELSSGRVADLGAHLSGLMQPIADIEHRLTVLSSYQTAAREAATDTSIMQTALAQVQDSANGLATQAITVMSSPAQDQLGNLAFTARQTLDAIIGALNTEVAGRAVFSGVSTDSTSLVDGSTVVSELRNTLSGAQDLAEIDARLETFFDAPDGGFQTLIYRGGAAGVTPYQLGSGESVALDIRADNPELRSTLRNVALLAVVDDDVIAVDESARMALASDAGLALLARQSGLTSLRANLGTAEARIDRSATRIAAEITGLEIARSDIIGADPFETAVELEQAQFQLEALYTVTARASRLSLVNFL